jgi:7-carboxy-7-deazaguanine synthase
MRIAELFHSIQGEGKLAGVPSAFVRTSGCNLRCVWCDTPYASWNAEGQEMAPHEIAARVESMHARHVVITGGEPVIAPGIDLLCQILNAAGHHLTLETAGTIFKRLPIDLASISPKLSNSTPRDREGGRFADAHEKHRLNLSAIQQFIDTSPAFQLKFVLSSQRDLAEIDAILGQLHNWSPADVLLMPEGTEPPALAERARWIVEICKQTGFRYCPRLQVELWGNRRGV